jgi:hypothetical protein
MSAETTTMCGPSTSALLEADVDRGLVERDSRTRLVRALVAVTMSKAPANDCNCA